MFDMTDYDPEHLFDSRTGALRLGSRLRGSVDVAEVLSACLSDFRAALYEGETGDAEEYDFGVKIEGLIEILGEIPDHPPLSDLAARNARQMFEFLTEATPQFTLYGPHRDDATDFGVWIQWDKLDEQEVAGALTRVCAECDYVVVGDRAYDARTAGILDAATTADVIASGEWWIEYVEPAGKLLLVDRPDGKAILYALPDDLVWETSDE